MLVIKRITLFFWAVWLSVVAATNSHPLGLRREPGAFGGLSGAGRSLYGLSARGSASRDLPQPGSHAVAAAPAAEYATTWEAYESKHRSPLPDTTAAPHGQPSHLTAQKRACCRFTWCSKAIRN
jgi:hypothetical protein